MAYKTIIPLGVRLLVEPLPKKEEVLQSGIVLAETVNADLSSGKVVKVAKEISHLFAEGDTVLYSTGTGLGQFLNGKTLVWLTANEIWGTVVREEA